MRNYKKFGLFLLVFGLVLVGSFATSVFKTKAVLNITVSSAKITGPNQLTIVFNTGGHYLTAAPVIAYGPANDGADALILTSDAGVDHRTITDITSYTATFTAVYTFDGAAASVNDTGSIAINNPSVITDAGGDVFTGITVVPVTDGQAPTLAASDIFVNNSDQPNKVILTFSEPLDPFAAEQNGDYIVTNGVIIYSIDTAVLSSSNVVTLTLAPVDPANNKTFITNNDFLNTRIRVTPNAGITDTATPANPYAGGLVTANVYGTYDNTPATVTAALTRTNATTYKVTFSEKLDLTTAQTLNKYTLGGTCIASTGNPSAAVLQNGVEVVLTIPDTSPCAGGQTVIVTPSASITDVAGWPITSSAATKILAITPLAQVTGAALSASGVATWNDVANESFFNARLYKNGEPVVSAGPDANVTTYDFLSYMRSYGAGVYTVTVTAIGDGVTYSNGPASVASNSQTIIQLATVSAGLTWTGDVAHWTAVSNGVSYDVQLFKGAPASGAPVNVSAAMIAGGVDFSEAITSAGSGTYTYKVTAKGNATLILDALAASAASNTNTTIVVPTLTTEDTATEIKRTTATIGGAIIDIGGENAFERGFKYGLTLEYENHTTQTGSYGATEFTADLTNLSCNKTYHYQSYASNSAGTGYGPDQTFKTNGCASSGGGSLPTFTHTIPPVISLPTLTSCPISIYGTTKELVKEKTRGINAKGVQNAINQMKAETPPLVIDGIIGNLSEAGIKNAQKILLVTPDGIWGSKTQQAYVLFIKKQCSTF